MGVYNAQAQKANNFKHVTITRRETIDGDRGRIATRRVTVFADIDGLRERHDWPGLRFIMTIESAREIDGERESETRCYIASFAPEAKDAAASIRSHWPIESAPQRTQEGGSP